MAEKLTPEQRAQKVADRHAAAEAALKRAKAAAKKARLDNDLALLSRIRGLTIESLTWDDWSEILDSPIPQKAETIQDALRMTAESILENRRLEAEQKKAETETDGEAEYDS